MKTEISKTPWHVAQNGLTIHEASGICIAEVFQRGTETPSPEANAELMARAPKLQAALRAALDVLETNAEEEGKFWGDGTPFAVEAKEIFENARAALAPAAPSNNEVTHG